VLTDTVVTRDGIKLTISLSSIEKEE